MDIELIDEENNHVKYGIIYTKDDIQDCIEQEASDIQSDVKVDGFRPGNVPIDYIVRMYGEKLRIQAMNKKVTSDINKIIEDNKYELASQPVYKFRQRSEVGDSNFYIELELFLMPELPQLNYSHIQLNEFKVSEEAFQEILDRNILMFQIMTADFNDLTDEVTAENDRVTFSVEVSIDNEISSALSGQMQAILGQEQAPAEIEAQLLGRKQGEEFVYNHTYPTDAKDVFSPNLLGKSVSYKISIEKVQRPVIHELDEERIKKIGFRDHDHLFNAIEGNTKDTLDKISYAKLREDFVTYLQEAFKDVVIPEFVIDQEAHLIAVAEAEAYTQTDVMAEIAAGTMKVDVTEKHRATAQRSLRIGLFIRRYAKDNSITVSDNETKLQLEKHLPELARLNQAKPNQKEQNYREMLVKSKMLVLETKVFDSIFASIKRNETILPKDEFFDKVRLAV